MISEKFVACGSHREAKPAFVCCHLLQKPNVGWNEPNLPSIEKDDDFADSINAWCNECDKRLIESGEWNAENEALAKITLVCEECALQMKVANLKGNILD